MDESTWSKDAQRGEIVQFAAWLCAEQIAWQMPAIETAVLRSTA
jgi:hypothetical protein